MDLFSEVLQLCVSNAFGLKFVSDVAYKKNRGAYNCVAKDMAKYVHKMEGGEAIKCRTIPLMHYQPLPC